MENPTTRAATSQFIAGVKLPVIPAEDDIAAWFKNSYELAAEGAHLEVDDSAEIERLLNEGGQMIAALRP